MIKILIVDDHQLVARSLAATLSLEPDIEVLATAYDHLQAVRRAQIHRPEVVLMDIVLGAASGLDAARDIGRALPATKIVFLSSFIDPQRVLDALDLDAAGYLTKTQPPEAVADALRAVHRGRRAYCALARRIAEAVAHQDARAEADPGQILAPEAAPPDRPDRALAPREREVLRLRARGMSIPGVARALTLKPTTVRTLWERALDKLELRPAPHHGYIAIPRLTDSP